VILPLVLILVALLAVFVVMTVIFAVMDGRRRIRLRGQRRRHTAPLPEQPSE
jgi:hypothetical protein